MTGYVKLDQDLKLFCFDEKYVHICFLAEWSAQSNAFEAKAHSKALAKILDLMLWSYK